MSGMYEEQVGGWEISLMSQVITHNTSQVVQCITKASPSNSDEI